MTKKPRNKGIAALRALRLMMLRVARTNDSPHKVALGFGLGIFLGIMPGVGPFAALITAMALRLNKISAMLGALATNTWITFATLALAVKVGAFLTGSSWVEVYRQLNALIKDFHFKQLLSVSFIKIAFPVSIGFLVIAVCLGLIGYLAALGIIKARRRGR